MRFKKGAKVEVLSKKEVPSGSWHCAEIVSGNGHNYDIRYHWSLGATAEAIVERVSRKAIRPCPPPVEVAESWVPGDIIEMYDNVSWKIATVSKIMSGNYFLVRLLGSSQEFRVHKSDLRVRQFWKDDEWVVVRKGLSKSNILSTSKYHQKSSVQAPRTNTKKKLRIGDDSLPIENNTAFPESRMVSSKTLKRGSPYCSSHVEAYTGAGQKMRAIEKEGTCQRMVPWRPTPEKVDAVASPQEMLGEKYMHASFNNKTTGFFEMDMERRKTYGDVGCSLVRSLEPSDTESSACSVGSCSINSDSPYKLPHYYLKDPSRDTTSHSDDAESYCGWVYDNKYSLPTKEILGDEIHKLELHAYRCTIEALYASGPLSWEQEVLMTNLRLTLHISNDEHLTELRSLVSAETSFPIS